MKTNMKDVHLQDGKCLYWKGRLTNKKIDNLHDYYGQAIRRKKMKRDTWTMYFHKMSTEREPHHGCVLKETILGISTIVAW